MNKGVSGLIAAATCTAAFALMTGPAAMAAQSDRPAAPPDRPAAVDSQATRAPAASPDQITVTGCIQREADYRRAAGAGAGGALGSGVGTGNEFVLASAMMAGVSGGTPTSGGPATATGTSGSRGTAYELTGSKEGEAASFVGKRVEIVGKVKADTAGGPTANAPGSQDLKLRELEVSSIKETTGTCSSATAP